MPLNEGVIMAYFYDRQPDYQDKGDECARAVEPLFVAMAKALEADGWTAGEVATALLLLAKNNIMKRIARADDGAIRSHRL